MFCLEEETPEGGVVTLDFKNYLKCGCKIHSHTSCWMMYIIHKHRVECPICHTILQEIEVYQAPLTPQIPTIIIRREVREAPDEPRNRQTLLVFICIIVLIVMFLLIMRN